MPAPDFLPSVTPAAARDLSDDEFAELDDLLAATPEPLHPMDVVMLDGYLCGLLVQPEAVAPDDWLPYVFDGEARPLPEGTDADWHARTLALTMRRLRALDRALTEDGAFDPLILNVDMDDGPEDEAAAGSGAEPAADAVPADATPASSPAGVDAPTPQSTPDNEGSTAALLPDDWRDGLPPVSRPLAPWVMGFQAAELLFGPEDDDLDDDVLLALARIYRHLPVEEDDDVPRLMRDTLDAEMPLADVDEAVDDLVAAVADLAREKRYRVETVRRDAPKVGRNDPCPCGSGKKYKRCHGADAG